MEQLLDVGIIGGGPAGLSAALVLGRARRSVIVIDEGKPRNRVTHEIHGFLTRDRTKPADFRRIAREEISAYPTVRFVDDKAAAVTGNDGRFVITTTQGTVYNVRKLLFAVGKRDLPVEINGLTEVYGKSAFVCPYCDGWELRDRPLAIIAKGGGAHHVAKVLSGWSNQTVICSNGPDELTAEQREELMRHNVAIYDSPIQLIESTDGYVSRIKLEDGSAVDCTGIFFAPRLAAGSDLPDSLGCKMTETGTVVADGFGKTSVAGVYSAGDAATELYQAITAASLGSLAAVGINGELITEAWEKLG
ncbi:NAD(P)/FAD-dependent oxidoreductase [Paenibacillus harenae]|uniref:Thioredoxin reductase n=1 Tax=Paenibacillus harenae TaxID=306543 RepID=A0ABT9U3C4_PAEHA|nr:NAD(P)/FAD-dependent oxidoreductase [Paenibacillus harenae]MDQ0114139.1 thioredoxin reductase [Paenibacillus harenae]